MLGNIGNILLKTRNCLCENFKSVTHCLQIPDCDGVPKALLQVKNWATISQADVLKLWLEVTNNTVDESNWQLAKTQLRRSKSTNRLLACVLRLRLAIFLNS